MKKTLDYNNVPECDLIDTYVLKRLRMGLHTHILVTGLQGRGKSDFGIRMGERLSARIRNGINFYHEDIVDSLLKLLDRITKIKQFGEIIMIEEASVLFPSRRSMTGDNLAIGRILDTIRKKRAVLISNAPLYPSIDLHMRSMAEVLVECRNVIKRYKLVKAKAWRLQTSPHTGKTYRHKFRRGRVVVPFHFSKKSNPLIREPYEKQKDKFIDGLYIKLKARAQATERKDEKEINAGKSPLEKRNNNIVYDSFKKKHSAEKISKNYSLTVRQVYRIIQIAKDNGDFPKEMP